LYPISVPAIGLYHFLGGVINLTGKKSQGDLRQKSNRQNFEWIPANPADPIGVAAGIGIGIERAMPTERIAKAKALLARVVAMRTKQGRRNTPHWI